MGKFIYWLFTTKDFREFTKIELEIENILDRAENSAQVKSCIILLNRLDKIKYDDDCEEIIENLNARRVSLTDFFDNETY